MAQKSPLTALTVMYADRWNGTWFIELEDFRHQLMIEYHLRFLITSFLRLKRQWLFFLSINKSGGFYFFQIATLNYLFTQQVKLPLPKNKILKKNLLLWSANMKKEKLLQDPRLTRIFKIKIPDNKKRMPYQKAVIWYNLKNQAVVVASNHLNFENFNKKHNKRMMSWLYNSKLLFLRYYYNSLVKFYYPAATVLLKTKKNSVKLLGNKLGKKIHVRNYSVLSESTTINIVYTFSLMIFFRSFYLSFIKDKHVLEQLQNYLTENLEIAQRDIEKFKKSSHRYYNFTLVIFAEKMTFRFAYYKKVIHPLTITLNYIYVPKIVNKFLNHITCLHSLGGIKFKDFPGIFKNYKYSDKTHDHTVFNCVKSDKDGLILPYGEVVYGFTRSFKDEVTNPLPCFFRRSGTHQSNILTNAFVNSNTRVLSLRKSFNNNNVENCFWEHNQKFSTSSNSKLNLALIEKTTKNLALFQIRKPNTILEQTQINKFFFTPLRNKKNKKNLGLYQMVSRIPVYYFQRIYFYKKFPTLKLGFKALLKKYGHQLKFTHMERRLGTSLLFLTKAIQRVIYMRFFFSYVPTQWFRNDYRFLKKFVIFERYGSKRYFVSTVSLIHLAMSRGSATLLTDLLVRKLRKIQKHTLFLDCVEKLCRYFMAAFESSKAYPYSLCKGIEILFTGKLNGKERSNAWRFKLGPVHTSTFYTNTREEQAKCMTRYGMFNIRVRLKLGQIKKLYYLCFLLVYLLFFNLLLLGY